jgi:hypothetical protein
MQPRPAEAGARQEVGAARHQFQHLDEIDWQRQRDRAHHIVECRSMSVPVCGRESCASASCRWRLRSSPAADPLGDFVTDAEHAHRDALLKDHPPDA